METKIPRRRWFQVLPLVFTVYALAAVDRNNIGFGFSGMERDLGIGPAYAGLAAGVFFIGYLFLQIPSGIFAERWSAKKVIAIAITVWSIFATLMAFVQTPTQLLIIRFFLGFAEGSVLPPIVLLLKRWFPQHERARANAFWMISIPFALMVMAPICGWLLTISDWRTMFLIEGLVPLLWVVVFWFGIEDSPSKAKWLSAAERDYIENALAQEKKAIGTQPARLRDVLTNRNVLLLVVIWFCTQIGFSGYTAWLPTVLKEFTGRSNLVIGFLAGLPWLVALAAMPLNAAHSDRVGERRLHVAVPMAMVGIFFFLSVLAGSGHPVVAIACLIVCGASSMSFNGVWWAIPTIFLTDELLAVAIGLINAIGNLGGFFGPFVLGFLRSTTGSFLQSSLFLALACVLGSFLMLMLRYARAPASFGRAVAVEPSAAEG
ncbi:MAG: MFS transporter [Acetobacteraceae bacterium]|nr:MFS transporter [Acetobacteraceae bacterium]